MFYGWTMSKTTPPKGRPTTGRRDRQVAVRTSKSRIATKKFVWALFAIALLAAVLVLGTGTGGDAIDTSAVPFLLLSRLVPVVPPGPRS